MMLLCVFLAGCGKSKKTQAVRPEIEKISEDGQEPAGWTFDSGESENTEESDVPEEGSSEPMEEEREVDMTKVTQFDSPLIMYAVTNVNIRRGPDTEYEPLGMLKLGESVEAIGQDEDGWYEFMYLGNVAFACDDYLSEDEPAIPTPGAEEASADDEAAATAIAEAIEQAAEDPDKVSNEAGGVVIIGDSRCVMMQNATKDTSCTWICQKSKGYNWLVSTAIPEADDKIGYGTKVVIALGVNDIGNVNKYATVVNQKAAEWAERGAVTYYVSVNPVSENTRVSEDQVQFFNAAISGQLSGIRWIDTHSYLISNGFNATDGIHYDNETSRRIFQAIIGSL